MTVLVLGATGATGRLLVDELLGRGCYVRVIVRSRERLPEAAIGHDRLSVIEAGVADLSEAQWAERVRGCDAVALCLGHNLSVRGVFGTPWRLVTDALRGVCRAAEAIAEPGRPIRVVLMSSAGCRNHDRHEPLSLAHHLVLGALRWLVPPHADNEAAADHLRCVVGPEHPSIAWAVVRPDTLGREPGVTAYTPHPSPTRSALFNPGRTRRANVAHFMAELLTDPVTWIRWRSQMPVIYDAPG